MSDKVVPGRHLWFFDYHTGGDSGLFLRISRLVHSEQTPIQRIDIFDNPTLGRVFALDGIVMTTDADEFMYHEMLAHVAMFSHRNPRNVLIIGGGDGGTLREVLKHPQVEKVTVCEIDEKVVQAAKQHLSSGQAFNNEKVQVVFENGAEYVRQFKNAFDVIIVDSTDPSTSKGGYLFTQDFYKSCFEALKEDGVMTAETEDPFYDAGWLKMAYKRISSVFPIVKVYHGYVPTYPSGFWSYIFASKNVDPIKDFRVSDAKNMSQQFRYYNEEIHVACFTLPNFLKNILAQEVRK
ncbi:polyamine aminopropyltransferase [Pseudothermotoga thermarum]|uniref:Polyamine aminopropyltransferase n=1 Tax=Pseudothermotoga thermarum DSM 5069 TaxID=688269 RepID=F7YYH8_9THEM|nr:polyamine aminopropyltransferase [Pseudothermotoga thermarum]AEH51005.1 spermidine synthase [Pseudothermotoga thermarum DSM 5069]